MGKIFLKGSREPLSITDEKARIIKDELMSGALPDYIEINGMLISGAKNAIKFVQVEEEQNPVSVEDKIEDWDTARLKGFLGDYEAERAQYCKRQPEMINHPAIGFQREGLIQMFKEKNAIGETGIIQLEGGRMPYEELMLKERALGELQNRRAYAQKMEDEERSKHLL